MPTVPGRSGKYADCPRVRLRKPNHSNSFDGCRPGTKYAWHIRRSPISASIPQPTLKPQTNISQNTNEPPASSTSTTFRTSVAAGRYCRRTVERNTPPLCRRRRPADMSSDTLFPGGSGRNRQYCYRKNRNVDALQRFRTLFD